MIAAEPEVVDDKSSNSAATSYDVINLAKIREDDEKC